MAVGNEDGDEDAIPIAPSVDRLVNITEQRCATRSQSVLWARALGLRLMGVIAWIEWHGAIM